MLLYQTNSGFRVEAAGELSDSDDEGSGSGAVRLKFNNSDIYLLTVIAQKRGGSSK